MDKTHFLRLIGKVPEKKYFYEESLVTLMQNELVKRIYKLIKENNSLRETNDLLQSRVNELQEENEEFRTKFEELTQKYNLNQKPTNESPNLRFNMVTILFGYIHGFSKITDNSDSKKLMDILDTLMIQFDSIIEKYGILRIKTIGDSLMCAGGIPVKNITNPVDIVMAALEMQQAVDYCQNIIGNEKIWDIKLGIHTGPVSANMSGPKKTNYELKGDTVNIATRIESTSQIGKIVISANTYELVKEFFECELFGKMPVKYKGDISLYNVTGLLPELRENNNPTLPNPMFFTRFGLIQFTDIQEIILDRLEKELPPYLYYHNVKHTVDVVTEAELIGWGEGCNDEEILILKTAALFHDAGHMIAYDNHEFFGTQIAREMLPKFKYNQQQIDQICEIIMATKLPPFPKNKLEEIICDSDLDYLGRSDFIPVSNTLYRELKEQNKIGTLNEWNKLQIKFISGHQYFTKTARSLREVNKQKQIERISALIEPEVPTS